MKSLQQYIIESKGISSQIDILTNYIFDEISNLMYEDPEDPKFDNALIELIKKYKSDIYPIEINFSDIAKFDPKKYDLLTYRTMGSEYEDYECDMIVSIDNANGNYACMETDQPLLHINRKILRTRKTFERNKAEILNALSHELTHYIQHMCKSSSGGTNLKDSIMSVSADFADATEGLLLYKIISFIIYCMNPIEVDARKNGFYYTIKYDITKRIKQYKKKNKIKEITDIDDFCDFVINHEDYDNNILHSFYIKYILDEFEKDTWENYSLCFDDKNNKYREDSPIYVFLNICDAGDVKPHFPLPSVKQFYVMNINNETRFNEYKTKLVKHYRNNVNDYIKKLKKIIKSVYEDLENLEK